MSVVLLKRICGPAVAGVFGLALLVGPRGFSQAPAAQTVAPRAAAFGAPNVTWDQLTPAQMEHFLLTARILGERPAGKGVTNTKRFTFTDGHYIHDGHVQQIDIYKAEYKTKDGIEKNFRDSYKFNIAAYRLDKIMDLNIVPVCVLRDINGKPAAVDWWVDNVMFDEEGRRAKEIEPPDPNYWTRQLNTVRDFDQLIYNEDRNQGNLLIDEKWKLWAIDHSRSFRPNITVRDTKVLKRVSNKMLAAMKNLNAQVLRDNLLPLITEQDIRGLLARRDWMVKYFESEISSKGADVVVTDMPRSTPRVTIP